MNDEGWLKKLRKLSWWRELWERITKWDELRKLGNHPLVRATILMPLVGYLILFNDKLANYYTLTLVLDHRPEVRAEWIISGMSLSWRLYCFYIGLSLVAIGQIVYTLACPGLVKDYGSAAEFCRVEGPTILNARLLDMKLARPPTPEEEQLDLAHGGVAFPDEKEKRNIMVRWFVPLKFVRKAGRNWVASLYAVGFGLVAIPSLWTFGEVLYVIVRRIVRAMAN